jgi:Mg2+ and Co2+ transporter CorA
MRTLTILNFISIPLSLIATFGQNAKNIPLIGHDQDFMVVMGLMLATSAVMLAYFKFKKWL